ncbi:hypothetical protein QYM36_004255 [Artemia franciscana]|uniref:Uncharacterized protein n=1 Tax=Artemia franciscana TaxID=6661 RepID=A0AA88HY57_ARTSF|nr:hypothetical protein QYM36_004255 [Artemia franciscana]
MVNCPMREHDYDLVGNVNGQEIKLVFNNFKGYTAAGVDGTPIKLFKNFLSILIPIIVLLCNKVLKSGQWPSAWKTSLFIPLFKRVNPKAFENYRLIALVPALSKVLEKILDSRLSNWFDADIAPELYEFKLAKSNVKKLKSKKSKSQEFSEKNSDSDSEGEFDCWFKNLVRKIKSESQDYEITGAAQRIKASGEVRICNAKSRQEIYHEFERVYKILQKFKK